MSGQSKRSWQNERRRNDARGGTAPRRFNDLRAFRLASVRLYATTRTSGSPLSVAHCRGEVSGPDGALLPDGREPSRAAPSSRLGGHSRSALSMDDSSGDSRDAQCGNDQLLPSTDRYLASRKRSRLCPLAAQTVDSVPIVASTFTPRRRFG